ncbi:MAG: SpoIIE family protein phosphatase [Treponema sp.]|nr:SpoIIE family protein phosphatase [Treponema sp.]
MIPFTKTRDTFPRCVLLIGLVLFLFTTTLSAQSDLFWDNPVVFSGAGSFPVSASSDSFAAVAWQQAAVNRNPGLAADGFISIALAVKNSGETWRQRGIVAGPYSYSGTEPSILSLVIDNLGRIIIAVGASGSETEILISSDRGASFSGNRVNLGSENSVAPRIFVRADGGYILFITRGQGQSLSIYYALSDDGLSWSPFELFIDEPNLQLNFLPAHGSIGQRDIVFFQSLVTGEDFSSTFQLFFKTSDDNGQTWSESRRFSSFRDPVVQTLASPDRFDNQRPHLSRYGNDLLLVWERRYITNPPQIYSTIIGQNGNINGLIERVNSTEAYCNNPIGFLHEGFPIVTWFDNSRGNNRVFMARHDGLTWQNYELSGTSGEASFARPVVGWDGISIFWQGISGGAGRIYSVEPDRFVERPRITTGYTPGRPSRSERARYSWNIPADPSGILGFSWNWSKDQDDEPERQVMVYNTGSTANLNLDLYAPEEGRWYFSVIAHDFAGNWSAPSRIEYYRKTTPPDALILIEPAVDDRGYLTTNSFRMAWEPSNEPFLEGYTWSLQYLGNTPGRTPDNPPSRLMGTGSTVSYVNQDDGYWAFSVSAIDQAGNISERSSIVFRTNKFIPYTSVSYVDSSQDEQGVLTLRIIGRGFATNGSVARIILEPEDASGSSSEFLAAGGEFITRSDREISGLVIDNLEEGRYRLRLEHSSRGWYTAEQIITAGRRGTVKFGDYLQEWKPYWTRRAERKVLLNPGMALAAVLVVFCVLGMFAAVRGIGGVIAESSAVKMEALALITGDLLPMEKKKQITRIKKRGIGLRFKLAAYTTVLVLLVVVMVSSPLYYLMTRTQRETLLQGLWDRSTVLLEGLASSARAYLPAGNLLELGFLPSQSIVLPEANYVTITGFGSGSTIYNDHVWATNDRNILSKIDTSELQEGVSRIHDDLSPVLEEFGRELNENARRSVGHITQTIAELTQEGVSLALRTDARSLERLDEIQLTTRSLETTLAETLAELTGEIGSYPQFSAQHLPETSDNIFIFFKPVMFRLGTDDNYLRGIVRLEVSLDTIVAEISSRQLLLLQTILVVAVAALIIGIIGALILSTIIIKPIRKLVSHVETIRDTENMAKLAGLDINITSHDELAVLGSTINDMTHGLVKAAVAASDLSIGKEIQKKFIPLDLDKFGNKQSTGFKETGSVQFFGYYEGAKGVSGDYFDYKELDGRYWAIIKCDVAGKGIPAALIMIQVATMFLNYFKQWKPDDKGMRIEEVVYQINDFIETLAFKGRFAAFTLCLFDTHTGTLRFCNAGDNIVHLYDASESRIKTISLPETPATGVLPNFIVESKGGYKVQTLTLGQGDILLLYTDGIEEAKRKFRGEDFKETVCAEGETDTPHENHASGQADEELGADRVHDIINAVMARQVYTLRKHHNPEGEKELQFDFSFCKGTAEEVIMAMVSVEKMFRCYKGPNSGEDSKVLVDKKVDEFLKKHFQQYRQYCSSTQEFRENEAYMYYTYLEEDEQYDDLTILGIKRK